MNRCNQRSSVAIRRSSMQFIIEFTVCRQCLAMMNNSLCGTVKVKRPIADQVIPTIKVNNLTCYVLDPAQRRLNANTYRTQSLVVVCFHAGFIRSPQCSQICWSRLFARLHYMSRSTQCYADNDVYMLRYQCRLQSVDDGRYMESAFNDYLSKIHRRVQKLKYQCRELRYEIIMQNVLLPCSNINNQGLYIVICIFLKKSF